MIRRILAAIIGLSLAILAASFIAAPTTADAHNTCTGTCNQIWNDSGSQSDLGILDYSWSTCCWMLAPGTHSNVNYPYQADVEGFVIGSGWCGTLRQSNDGYNWGYYGTVRGYTRFTTTYWKYNRVYAYPC